MKREIAVLGWGSLIWSPRELNIINKTWRKDGPLLPIEFARKSLDGRVTLVIYDDYLQSKEKWVRVLWNIMQTTDLKEAMENLRQREGRKLGINYIGYASKIGKHGRIPEVVKTIDDWRQEKEFFGVIWTDLPPRSILLNQVLPYLKELTGLERVKAIEYIVKAPPQIRTALRVEIGKFWLNREKK
jgi:hypothetical protein